MSTRGGKSSEKKACYTAFIGGLALSGFGIHSGADLTSLSALILTVTAPLMWYAGNRTAYKWKHGECE